MKMKTISKLFGMAYASPAVRTIFQAAASAGLAVLVAAGTNIDNAAIELAFASAVAGGLAKLQEKVRG